MLCINKILFGLFRKQNKKKNKAGLGKIKSQFPKMTINAFLSNKSIKQKKKYIFYIETQNFINNSKKKID